MLLVTGASGFIGKNLVEQLGSKIDLLTPTHAELDLTDSKMVSEYLTATKPTKIINCASNDKDICLYDNLRMFHNLAESGIPMITFCTGREIEDRIYKNGEYVLSKYLVKELALTKYRHIGVIQIWGCFGLHEKPIRFFMGNMLRVKQGLPIVVDEDRYFSYIYVNDIVDMIKGLIDNDTFAGSHFKCVAYTEMFSEYANVLKDVTGSKLEIEIKSKNNFHSYVGNRNCEYDKTVLSVALRQMWNNIN